MATFTAKKLELTQVNGGQEYEQGDFLQSDTINDVVEGTAYAQNVAEGANTKSNNAVSTANSANSTANAASAKVDTFEQRITAAQNTADTAVSNAATAQSTADSATTEINKIKNGTTVVPNANHANNADNAAMATKAQQDVNGNPINTTYATVEYVDDLVTEKQGTRVTVNNVNVAELSFTSDPQTQITANKNAIAEAQTQIDNVSKFAVPSSETGTSRDSGLWALATGTSGGSFLLGTFLVYDTNISLHISGGIATSEADSTTDVDVFISTANYVANKAEYYVRHIYTYQLSGLYYTIDDSHYLRVFADLPAYGKFFIRAEVVGGTIAGRGSAGLQYPSGGTYLERKDYVTELRLARLSSDAAQIGWYRVADISTNSVATVKVCEAYAYNRPSCVTATIAVGYAAMGDATISVTGEVNNQFGFCKIRVCMKDSNTYIDLYNGTTNANSVVVMIEKASRNEILEPADFQYVGNSDTIDGFNIVSADFVNGINTSGKLYQNGAPVFATDPSKLAPSTANGWTQTTATGSLPSAGVYMVIPNASMGTIGIGVMFYAANEISVSPVGTPAGADSLYYVPSGDTKWALYSGNGTAIQLIDVHYKRIA